ncbi:MAG: maleylpyruvate isomerase N-terminal domain-containing protein, partial [Actinomycetota bacterium]|nr:maleylpyruvate isomerase N-terminal domain-containing protein [Actinomycetota bacterium]
AAPTTGGLSLCRVGSDLDHISHLARESARFAAAVAEAAPVASVPTCPEWDADDLLWHLAEVQWFWGTIVRQALQEPPPAEMRPERPANRAELTSFYDAVSAELATALASSAPRKTGCGPGRVTIRLASSAAAKHMRR